MSIKIPTDQELLAMYSDVLTSAAVIAVSGWKETNHDGPFDEATYLEKSGRDANAYASKMQEVLVGIGI